MLDKGVSVFIKDSFSAEIKKATAELHLLEKDDIN